MRLRIRPTEKEIRVTRRFSRDSPLLQRRKKNRNCVVRTRRCNRRASGEETKKGKKKDRKLERDRAFEWTRYSAIRPRLLSTNNAKKEAIQLLTDSFHFVADFIREKVASKLFRWRGQRECPGSLHRLYLITFNNENKPKREEFESFE